MVRNDEVMKEFDLFSAVWKFFKESLPVRDMEDDAYWNQVVASAEDIHQAHASPLCTALVIAIIEELERRSKERK